MILLLGREGDSEVKSKHLIVYHSENPMAFKGYVKLDSLLISPPEKKVWMTKNFSEE